MNKVLVCGVAIARVEVELLPTWIVAPAYLMSLCSMRRMAIAVIKEKNPTR